MFGSCFLFLITTHLFAADPYQQTKIDSLKQLLSTAKNDTAVAKSMHELGRIYRRVNSDTAHYWLQKLIAFATQKKLDKYVAKGLMTTANVLRFDNHFEKAAESYRKALVIYQRIRNIDGIAQAYGCLMKCAMSGTGPADSVQYYFDIVISYKDSAVKDKGIIADAYSDFSEFLTLRGDYHLAMDYLQPALTIYQKRKDYQRVWLVKNTIGTIHVHLNNQAKADEIFEEIAPKELQYKSYPLYMVVLTNLAESYKVKKDYKKAQEAYLKALFISKKYNTRFETDLLYASIADLKLDLHQPDSAIYFAQKALRVKKTVPFSHPANLALANAYMQKGNFVTAALYAQNYLKEQLKNRKKEDAAKAYEVLFTLHEKWGKYEQAIAYHHLYEDLRKVLYSEDNSNRIADMEAWYWSTQKKNELKLAKKNEELQAKELKEIQIEKQLYASQRNGLIIGVILIIMFCTLLYKITIQSKKNKLMQQVTALELKAIRAQMNPHFLFNALSAIQMLINKSDIRQANTALAQFGKLMRLILENSEKQTISIEDEIRTLELYIQLESLRFPFNYAVHIDSTLDTENMQIPSMIIQPYVENAIKHGIANRLSGREINVDFKQQGTQLCCTIQDNGIGRIKAEATKSKYAQHKSMGTKLSGERLELISRQISGKAEVSIQDLYNEEGDALGTLVQLSIPITYFEN